MNLVNPVTGEMLGGSHEAMRAAVAQTDAEMGHMYRRIGWLREERDRILQKLGEDVEYELPPKRYQTRTQQKVDQCPNCRTVLGLVKAVKEMP